jgi:predicted metalloprotease
MRWTPGGRSKNLEDRRGMGGVGRGLGIGGTVIVLALSLITGRNLFNDLGVEPGVGAGTGAPLSPEDSARQENQVLFVSFVLDDADSTWQNVLSRYNQPYTPPRLVLFRNSTQSGCGIGQSAMGPFYCPLDQRIYIDLGFYDELKTRFGADAKVRQAQSSSPGDANQLSVRMELQADCYAGIWANSTQKRNLLSAGDVEEAMTAASAVGDDRIQQQTGQRVNVDAFTHGSAAQRAEWFGRGFQSGDPRSCDTFS